MQLVEEAIDGCWIGHHARIASDSFTSGIGSVYSPPRDEGTSAAMRRKHVETVVDIGFQNTVGIFVSAVLVMF